MIGRLLIPSIALLAGFSQAQQDTPVPAPAPAASTAPASPAPVAAAPAVAPAPAAESAAAPAPAPVAAAEKPIPRNKGDLITVTSSGGAEIHQKKNLMVYLQNVKFDHPTQNLVMKCDRLEVYRDPPPPPGPKQTLEQEAAQGQKSDDAEEAKQPDLKEAIAIGNVVITKKSADKSGGNNVGRGQKAVFNGKTRDVELSGNPSLEIGDNQFFADTIILREDGQHKLLGAGRTVFKPKKSKDKEKGGTGGNTQP